MRTWPTSHQGQACSSGARARHPERGREVPLCPFRSLDLRAQTVSERPPGLGLASSLALVPETFTAAALATPGCAWGGRGRAAVRPPGPAVRRGPQQAGREPCRGRGVASKPHGAPPRGCDGPGLRVDTRCPGSGQLGLPVSVAQAPPRAQGERRALPRSSPPTPRRPLGPPACPSTGRRPPAAPGPRAPSSATCPRPTRGSR